jgi:RNA polymerase sigma-70 factor (ECF subfamily)
VSRLPDRAEPAESRASAPDDLELLLRERRWLRRLAGTLVVDAAAADDLAQEALRVALAKRPAGLLHPRAWLATIARRLRGRDATAEGRRELRERAAAVGEALPGTDDLVARLELQQSVSAALLHLPEPWRTTLALRFVDELSPRAIALRTGVPVETVRTRTRRALELLRERLIATRGAPPRQWAVALVGWLDGGLRTTVRRAVEQVAAAKAAVATGTTAGGGLAGAGAAAALAMSGALFMSAKLKAMAVALVLVAGSAALVTLLDRPDLVRPERIGRDADDVGHGAAVISEPVGEPGDLAAPVAARGSTS